MAKEKQKMTLNVRRRPTEHQPPLAIDSAKLEAFASGAENARKPEAVKPVEQKVVRDAFTMPSDDHALFAKIQKKCLAQGMVVTKSEIVRAGLKYFADLKDGELIKIIKAVPKLKTGRPAVEKLNRA
jgi:hypothetical protein